MKKTFTMIALVMSFSFSSHAQIKLKQTLNQTLKNSTDQQFDAAIESASRIIKHGIKVLNLPQLNEQIKNQLNDDIGDAASILNNLISTRQKVDAEWAQKNKSAIEKLSALFNSSDKIAARASVGALTLSEPHVAAAATAIAIGAISFITIQRALNVYPAYAPEHIYVLEDSIRRLGDLVAYDLPNDWDIAQRHWNEESGVKVDDLVDAYNWKYNNKCGINLASCISNKFTNGYFQGYFYPMLREYFVTKGGLECGVCFTVCEKDRGRWPFELPMCDHKFYSGSVPRK